MPAFVLVRLLLVGTKIGASLLARKCSRIETHLIKATVVHPLNVQLLCVLAATEEQTLRQGSQGTGALTCGSWGLTYTVTGQKSFRVIGDT